MFVISVPARTFNVPPLLNNAPPPSSARAPLAEFPVKTVASIVIIPALFHNPPPSWAAWLFSIVLFEISAFVVPER